jgi:hypothetical protein
MTIGVQNRWTTKLSIYNPKEYYVALTLLIEAMPSVLHRHDMSMSIYFLKSLLMLTCQCQYHVRCLCQCFTVTAKDTLYI